MGPAVPALLGCNRLMEDLDAWCGMRCLRCSFDVMVDVSESQSLILMAKSATVCWRLVIISICLSIRSLVVLFDSVRAAIICI